MSLELKLNGFTNNKLILIYNYLYSKENLLITMLEDFIKKFNLKEKIDDYYSICFEVGNPYYCSNYSISCLIYTKEFDIISNSFYFEEIPDNLIDYDLSEIENSVEEEIADTYYEIFHNKIESIIFSWFAKCWQKAGGINVLNQAYIYKYYTANIGLDLNTMIWSGDFSSNRKRPFFNTGKLSDFEIEQLTQLPNEKEKYKLYFEKENEFFYLTLDSNKIIIESGISDFKKDTKVNKYTGFDTCIEIISDIIIDLRKKGFVIKNKCV